MSAEDASLRTIEAFNRRDAAAFAAGYATGAVAYDPQYSEPLKGREAIREDIQAFFDAFPDGRVRLINSVTSGNTAASEVEFTGTQLGSMATPTGSIPPTNRRVTLRLARFIQVDTQGQIVKESRYYDLAGMMHQLGLM